MRTIIIVLISIFTVFNLTAQDFTGQWNGLLQLREKQLTVVFHVTKTDDGFNATIQETFSHIALNEILTWIQAQTK